MINSDSVAVEGFETILFIPPYDQTRSYFLQGCTFDGIFPVLTDLKKRGFNSVS